MNSSHEPSPHRRPTPPVRFNGATVEDLTARERDVLELVAAGLANVEIAERLFVSPNTVKTYVRSTYRKIGASSRSRAVLWAVQHGLLDIPGVTVVIDEAAVAASQAQTMAAP